MKVGKKDTIQQLVFFQRLNLDSVHHMTVHLLLFNEIISFAYVSSRKDQKKDTSHCVSHANVAGSRHAIFAHDSHLHMHASHSMLSSVVGQNITFHFFFFFFRTGLKECCVRRVRETSTIQEGLYVLDRKYRCYRHYVTMASQHGQSITI